MAVTTTSPTVIATMTISATTDGGQFVGGTFSGNNGSASFNITLPAFPLVGGTTVVVTIHG